MMHIPDKYRDRYDRLAASHPWMREMRDEDARDDRESYEERLYDVKVSDCPYCGCDRVVIHEYNDAYERPNSYRIEHVDEKDAFNCDCFTSYYGFDSIEKAVEHADMRDEPTNGIDRGTNGIAADSPLADEPPEGDAIEHARWRWKYRPEDGDEVVMSEYNCNLLMSDLDAIADMVERDYIRKSDVPEGDALEELRFYADTVRYDYNPLDDAFEPDERLSELCGQVADMVERDYVKRGFFDAMYSECKRLEAETIEYDKALDAIKNERDELTNAINELQKKQPYCYDPEVPLDTLRTIGRYIDELKSRHCPHYHVDKHYCDVHETRINKLYEQIHELEAERDEALEIRDKACGDAAMFKAERDELKVELTHFERFKNKVIPDLRAERDQWRDAAGTVHDMWEQAATERDEWKAKAETKSAKRALAVERLKNSAGARFSPDAIVCALLDGRCGSVDWSLECEAILDLLTDDDANDDSTPQSDVSADDVDANDRNATCNNSGENVTHDSREKLETDLKTHLYEFGGYCFSSREGHTDNVDTFFDDFVFLLDRQVAITTSEATRIYESGCEACRAAQKRRIAELTRKLEDAEFERDTLREKLDDDWKYVGLKKQVELLKAKVDKLTAENAALEQDREALDHYSDRYAEMDAEITRLTADLKKKGKHCENQRKALRKANDQIRDYKHALENDEDVLYNGGGAKDWYDAMEGQMQLVEGLERRNVALVDENERLKAEIIQYGKDCGDCGTAMPKGVSWPRWSDGSLVEFGQRPKGQPPVGAITFKRTMFELEGDGYMSGCVIDRDLYGTTYERDGESE